MEKYVLSIIHKQIFFVCPVCLSFFKPESLKATGTEFIIFEVLVGWLVEW